MLLPGYNRDARFVSTIVMRRAGGKMLQRGGSRNNTLKRNDCPVLRGGVIAPAGTELLEDP